MNIIINHSSMVPIYEQIVDVVKTQIRKGELKEDENLPSVRMLAKELKLCENLRERTEGQCVDGKKSI